MATTGYNDYDLIVEHALDRFITVDNRVMMLDTRSGVWLPDTTDLGMVNEIVLYARAQVGADRHLALPALKNLGEMLGYRLRYADGIRRLKTSDLNAHKHTRGIIVFAIGGLHHQPTHQARGPRRPTHHV